MNSGGYTTIITSVNSTLYVDGQPVMTEGTISTVSTVFWDDGPAGSIHNKNIGTGAPNYLVGVGTTTNPLNATLDVLYAGGTTTGNTFNVSSNTNRFTITNINNASDNYITANLINNQNDI